MLTVGFCLWANLRRRTEENFHFLYSGVTIVEKAECQGWPLTFSAKRIGKNADDSIASFAYFDYNWASQLFALLLDLAVALGIAVTVGIVFERWIRRSDRARERK